MVKIRENKQNGLEIKRIIKRTMVIIKCLYRIMMNENFSKESKRFANNHMYTILWGLTRLSIESVEIDLNMFEQVLDDAEQIVNHYFDNNRVNELESLMFMYKNVKVRG